jgi:hypothetical protein
MSFAALILSHSITPRLEYIAAFLSRYYGAIFKLTSDEDGYVKSGCLCKINYSYHPLDKGEIWMHSHALLTESAIHPVKLELFDHPSFSGTPGSYKAFFKTEGNTGFDLFAAIFFLITRYEEHLPHKKDMYGRYAHENSFAFKEHFLAEPLVNTWLEDFRTLLAERDPIFNNAPSFTFIPTYDIDMAWSYLHKGMKRNMGAFLNSFIKGKWRSVSERSKVLRSKLADPFDTYEWMDDLHDQYKLDPIYFFLVAHQTGKYDKNISLHNPAFKELVKASASRYNIGLHPSWHSGDVPHWLIREKEWLEQTSGKTIDMSRQHYIRFDLPQSYRRLITAGIRHEHSMGYGSINGFRASIASSYYWYDLKNEESTSLLIHPFCFMDANSFYEQKQTPEETAAELTKYYEAVRTVNGTMITIWHNSFLGTASEFSGWREVYQQFIKNLSKEVISSS